MSDDTAAGVFEGDGAGNVMELNRLKRFVEMRAADVDRRLLVALGAGLIGGIEFAPDDWTGLSFVVSSWEIALESVAAQRARESEARKERRMRNSDLSVQVPK